MYWATRARIAVEGDDDNCTREGVGRPKPGPRSGVLVAVLLAALAILQPLAVAPASAASAAKVVIVVGATRGTTASYRTEANAAATTARKYTSNVSTIYSPYATWDRVRPALQGANIVLYLGDGNGFPSPYSSTLNPYSMDGFGLNATYGAGDYNTKYYGEYYIASEVKLAPNAVVLFSRLCYASGDSEWGAGTPTLSVAKQRVDNYAAGFIKAGAKAVIADGLGDPSYYISSLFTRHSSIDSLFRAAPNAKANYTVFTSTRSAGFTDVMDIGTYSWVPDGDPYYRSMVSIPTLATDSVVGIAAATANVSTLTGKTVYDAVNIRSGPSTAYGVVGTIPAAGTSFSVVGPIAIDGAGRTWAKIRLASGLTGYTSTQYSRFSGSAAATAPLNARSAASTGATVLYVIPQGGRFTVSASTTDSAGRTWFATPIAGGGSAYVASWYTTP